MSKKIDLHQGKKINQETHLQTITVGQEKSNISKSSKMQFKLKIWKYSKDFRIKKVILMLNNGIVKEKM